MTNNWEWWVGYSDECYTQKCVDREEAIQIAQEEFEGAHIVEAKQDPQQLADQFDLSYWLENVEESCEDLKGENCDPIFESSPEKEKELELAIKKTISDWQEKHNLVFIPFCFSDQRNEEYIPALEK